MEILALLVMAYVAAIAVYVAIEHRNAWDEFRQLIHTIKRLRAVYHVVRKGVYIEAELDHRDTELWAEHNGHNREEHPGDCAADSETPTTISQPTQEDQPCGPAE
jgi:hypothetical protein